MQPRTPKLLEDIRTSLAFIRRVTTGKTLGQYARDELLRAGVERHFEIIGVALNRLTRQDREIASQIDDLSRIVAFRNILIHGYDAIDDRRVWDAIENHVPMLYQQVTRLLQQNAVKNVPVFGIDFSGAKDAGKKTWLTACTWTGAELIVHTCQSAAEFLNCSSKRTACLRALYEFVRDSPPAAYGFDFPFGLPRAVCGDLSWRETVLHIAREFVDEDAFREWCIERANRSGEVPRDRAGELPRRTDRETGTPLSAYNRRMKWMTFHGMRSILEPVIRFESAYVLPMIPPPREDLELLTLRKPWILEICPASLVKKLGLPTAFKAESEDARRNRRSVFEQVATEAVCPVRFEDGSLQTRILADDGGDALDSLIAAVCTARALRHPPTLLPDGDEYAIEGYVYGVSDLIPELRT